MHRKRIAILLVLASTLASAGDELIRIDVSGRKGTAGKDGHTVNVPAEEGEDGQNGGDAGPPSPGRDAGKIYVTLKRGPKGTLILRGTVDPPGQEDKKIRRKVKIGEQGYVSLLAQGGNGGRGGHGGDGQDGGPGSDGEPADTFSKGTDGGPGGNGGNGGNATSGANGGDGGKIEVKVAQKDMHLIMLLAPNVQGGRGGPAGKNGKGGRGGPGGRGGKAYEWEETNTRTVTKQDSDGKQYEEDEEYTVPQKKEGGKDGPAGKDGQEGNAEVTKGERGAKGNYKIIVESPSGRLSGYSSPYDMEIVGFEIDTENDDGVFEPGEKATVRKLRVRNSGGMPTPPNYPVKVYLASSDWVVPEGEEIKIRRSLAPGEEYVFRRKVLPFKIPETRVVSVDKPFERTDETTPLAYQAKANRPYRNFSKPQEFTIRFPIRIEPVYAIETLAPGDMVKMDWRVTNISGRDFGGASLLRREIATSLGLGNREQMLEHIVLMDANGNPLDWNSGLLQEISLLKAGESTVLKGMVGVLPTAPNYHRANIEVGLEIGKIDKPSERKLIQQNTYPVRIGERYKKTDDSDILLVTNHGTTDDEIEAWRKLAERSGKKLDVWDVSLNDFLDLDRSITYGENLLKDFHGKTIVILNNQFKTIEGDKHADELMGQMDLIRATASHGIRILVVNEDKHGVEDLMTNRLIPTDTEVEYGYQDLKRYLAGEPDARSEKGAAVELQEKFKPPQGRKEVKVNPLDTTGQIPIVGYRAPNEKRLAAQAAKMQKAIEAQNPGARVVVTYEVGTPEQRIPDYAKQGGWLGSYHLQGMLTVRPTVKETQPNILAIDVSSKALHSPEFIAGEGMDAVLVQAFNFEDKLSSLEKVLGELINTANGHPQFEARLSLGRKLVDAILVDLAVEQDAVLRHGWTSGLSAETLKKNLNYLNRIGHYQTHLDLSQPSPAADLMADLVGGIQFLAKNQARWYERLPLPWAPWRRGSIVSDYTKQMAQALATQMFGPIPSHSEALTKRLNERVQELTERRNQLRSQPENRLSKKQAASRAVMDPLLSEAVKMDALYTFNRVLSQGDWNAIHDSEAQLESDRLNLQIAKGRQKGQYMIVDNGQLVNGEYAHCAQRFLQLLNPPETAQKPAPEPVEAPSARPAF